MLAAALRRSSLRGYACRIAPQECKPEDRIVVTARAQTRFRPFLILIRYSITLKTLDERESYISFDPERSPSAAFLAGERGAYFAAEDRLEVFDAFGFFKSIYRVPAEGGARLLVRPSPADKETETPQISGGAEVRTERTFRRTEDLTDNRRYTPGDDPRRINWKIYGHAGELFVREGEPEPPPRSRFVILLDASVDPNLFDLDLGRRAVDALAEKALGLVTSVIAAGFEPRFGFNGSAILTGTARDAAAAFAIPSAVALDTAADLPQLGPADRNAFIFALPRICGGPSALDRYFGAPAQNANTELLFIVPDSENWNPRPTLLRFILRSKGVNIEKGRNDPSDIERIAFDCVALYGGRSGVHARREGA
jgi:uncharacterized protein (DUF58 family)